MMWSAEPDRFDVGVVGLGPTGLVMAHLLAEHGLRVLVLEREPDYYGQARAVHTDDECLRILQRAGVADELHADMLWDLPVRWIRRDGQVIGQFHDPSRPLDWPKANFLYQPVFEATLEARLRERGTVTIRRGRAVLEVAQDGDGVVVTHAGCAGADYGRSEARLVDGTTETTRVPYLVAADGGRSIVRTSLGIDMTGRSFPQRWLVIDLSARPGARPFDHLSDFDFICDAQLPTVSCPQPGNRHRFEFMLHDDDQTAEFERAEKALQLLSRHVDPADVVIDRQLVYTFNALVADRWRVGRIFLAGDAAHMTPQFIGQGMNAGIRDADNLSWKLADVIHRRLDPSILDTYEPERRPHAKAMIDLSVFNKDLVSTGNRALGRLRDLGLPVLSRMPFAGASIRQARMKPRPRFRGSYLGLPRRRRRTSAPEGSLFPQPRVSGTRLDDLLGSGWAVIGIGADPREAIAPEVFGPLAPTVLTLEPGETDDDFRHWLRRHGLVAGSVVVLRPDRYVLSATAPGEHGRAATFIAGLRASSLVSSPSPVGATT